MAVNSKRLAQLTGAIGQTLQMRRQAEMREVALRMQQARAQAEERRFQIEEANKMKRHKTEQAGLDRRAADRNRVSIAIDKSRSKRDNDALARLNRQILESRTHNLLSGYFSPLEATLRNRLQGTLMPDGVTVDPEKQGLYNQISSELEKVRLQKVDWSRQAYLSGTPVKLVSSLIQNALTPTPLPKPQGEIDPFSQTFKVKVPQKGKGVDKEILEKEAVKLFNSLGDPSFYRGGAGLTFEGQQAQRKLEDIEKQLGLSRDDIAKMAGKKRSTFKTISIGNTPKPVTGSTKSDPLGIR